MAAPRHCSRSLATATVCVLLLAAPSPSAAVAASESAAAMLGGNPVRKVVNLLEKMHDKAEEEGRNEEKLMEKFMCYCKSNKAELEASIKAAEDKLPPLKSSLEAAVQEQMQLQAEVDKAKADREEAEKALADASALREKEAATFAESSSEQEQTIDSIDKAVEALTTGMAESFLQTSAAESLRRIAIDKDGLLDGDRQELLAFLDSSHSSSSDYVPQSGEINGMLKTMGDEAKATLAEARAAEKEAVEEFKSLRAAKTKEIKALTSAIEKKTERVGDLKVVIVQVKADVEDTQDSLDQDNKFFSGLQKSCDKKAADWDVRVKTRQEELKAITETIKILDNDNALDTLQNAMPSKTSFLQVSESSSAMKARALAQMNRQKSSGGEGHSTQMDLIFMALRGKKVGFEKVIKMIEGMKKTLGKEQDSDDKKKDYCGTQFDSAGDKKQDLTLQVSDKGTAIDSAKEGIAMLEEEIKALTEGIKKLDQEVAEATEQRKEENEAYTKVMSDNSAAKELIGLAKQRMNQFYNPSQVGEGEAALVEVSSHRAEEAEESAEESVAAPPPPPETFDDYSKKSEGSSGVIGMLDTLIKDMEKQMVEAKTDEKYAQQDYQELMQDSGDKRSADSKSLAAKTSAKGDLDADLQAAQEAKASSEKELAATERYIQNLHTECDWLLKNFEVRQDARAGEIESLDRAKAVLSGADYSLLQDSEEDGSRRGQSFLAPARTRHAGE